LEYGSYFSIINLECLANNESKKILKSLSLYEERDRIHFDPWIGRAEILVFGELVLDVNPSMCSAILTKQPVLLQEDGKHLSVHSAIA
jgi:hypothetical protein